jgi:hypothetical protein
VSGDIVRRMRHIWMEPTDDAIQEVVESAADEITRLRAAGDALAEVADEWPELAEAWQEARRER